MARSVVLLSVGATSISSSWCVTALSH